MREPNISNLPLNRPAICISSGVYDRRALDCTATVPLINSLTHLAYLTSSSSRIREALAADGGLERIMAILSDFSFPNDKRHLWKWWLAFQCMANLGIRGTEQVRTKVVQCGGIHIATRILENFVIALERSRIENESRGRRDAQPVVVLAPEGNARGYNALYRPSVPADAIAHMLSTIPSQECTFDYSWSGNSDYAVDILPTTTASPAPPSSPVHSPSEQSPYSQARQARRAASSPYMKINPEIRRKNRLLRMPASSPSRWKNSAVTSIDNLFYREEDILLALQLLAYLSKYPHIRNVFHLSYKDYNVFHICQRFCHRLHSQTVRYWAGVIMRNACRKDDKHGGIRRCANMECKRWETQPREFAKCRRCRKSKYCSKACQSTAWAAGHRWWCVERSEQLPTTATNSSHSQATAAGSTAESVTTTQEPATAVPTTTV